MNGKIMLGTILYEKVNGKGEGKRGKRAHIYKN
jgi:hypothetical protein